MRRRSFVGLCGAALVTNMQAQRFAARAADLTKFERVELVGPGGEPLRAAKVMTSQAYVFHYPYKATPCFLIRLQHKADEDVQLTAENGHSYRWPGGSGPDGDVVAFSAICAHQLSYPSKALSPIGYSPGYSKVAGRAGMIVCCTHHSVYDPSQGARVASGPAQRPLAAIGLEYDATSDALYATGVYGAPRFDDFFLAYKEDLITALGPGVAHKLVTGTVEAVPLDQYTGNALHC